jgi:NAD(P)-dependent dehydrogenase (short-subunit alcohol dehydrogenase family)
VTTPQHKIGSGFGATTTAAEVLTGIDLTGKLAIVTGGYAGIGLETTRALTGAGAHVVIPARRRAAADEAVTGIPNVEVDQLDLADLSSVGAFADRFLSTGRGIDLLINNAGIMAPSESRVGLGWEAHFAINHLGHFALTNRLHPALRPGARVVSVSSSGHHFSPIRWDDLHFARGYDKWQAYGQSKTANILFAVHLDTLARGAGIRAFSLHPGGVLTNLARQMSEQDMLERGIMDESGNIVATWLKTPEQGATTQVWAATSPQLTGMGGVYLEDCDIADPAPIPADINNRIGVRDYAIDPHEAARLWTLSAELTGVDTLS